MKSLFLLLVTSLIMAQNISLVTSNTTEQLNKIAFASLTNGAIAGSSGIILVTTDGGITWIKKTISDGSGGTVKQTIHSITFCNGIYHGVGTNGTYIVSTDTGKNWLKRPNFNGSKTLYGIYTFNNILFATGNGGIWKSTDNGQTWVAIRYGGSTTKPVLRRFYFVNDDIGFVVGMYGAVLKTTNGGVTFDSLNVRAAGNTSNVDLFSVFFINEMVGFVGGANGALYKTSDGGNSWTNISLTNESYIYNIHFIDNLNGIITGSKGTIAKTTDGGNTWNFLSNGFINTTDLYWGLHIFDNNNLLVVGNNGKILKISNATLPVELENLSYNIIEDKIIIKWSTKSEINAFHFEIYRTDIYNNFNQTKLVATLPAHGNCNYINYYKYEDKITNHKKSIYKIKQVDFDGNYKYFDDIIIENRKANDKIDVIIYPNPFNPETKINYYMPFNDHIKIKILDLCGKEIATLHDGYQLKGNYQISFNSNYFNLASGVYFISINGTYFNKIQKIVLMK